VSRSLRTTSSPHRSSASHPTGHIFAEGHEALNEVANPAARANDRVLGRLQHLVELLIELRRANPEASTDL